MKDLYLRIRSSNQFSISSEEMEQENKNQLCLSLLRNLEEYMNVMAQIQGKMIDGYIEIAQSRRKSSGVLDPNVLSSPNQSARKIVSDLSKFEPKQFNPFVPGVTQQTIDETTIPFEESLIHILKAFELKKTIFQQIQDMA